MKVLIAVHHFPPLYAAGAELRAFRTARWMRAHGHDARVICVEDISHGPNPGLIWEDDEYQGIPVRRLFFNVDHYPSSDPLEWEFDNVWIEQHLDQYFKQLQPDIYHVISGYLTGAGAMRAAFRAGTPVVVTPTDFWFICPRMNLLRMTGELSNPERFDAKACARCKLEEKRRYRLPAQVAPQATDLFWSLTFDSALGRRLGATALEQHFIRRNRTLTEMLSKATAVVCPSRFLVETLRARGALPEQVFQISHGLDTTGWLPAEPRDAGDNVFRIGYLGQVEPHKGIHVVVDALNRMDVARPLELWIHGNEHTSPSYTTQLRKLAQGDPRVVIKGRYPYEEVARIMARFDVLVIPSLWNEIGPWVMFEAFQTKTPVIASDLPNMSYVINHEENGLLFRRGDSQDLALQLHRLIEDPNLRQRIIDGIRPPKTIDQEMAELEEVYNHVWRK
jgi:glycosyltransferase involved in cell wall biosynthesis